METRHFVLARSEKTRQHLKILVKKRQPRFGEARNREFAIHDLEDAVDIEHQPNRIDPDDLIGVTPDRQPSRNKACMAVMPVPSYVRPVGSTMQGRSSLAAAARFVHDNRKHWVLIAELMPGTPRQSVLLDAMHFDTA